ncbi:GNAT family N-acetyltransferase [Angustibacter sp. McL0619]|uniref:GNAT family N-acetyltransferase n=1 Tax=Angustibacter sp. McL0619 TaxID=3415676 RepID=UPI003CEB7C01
MTAEPRTTTAPGRASSRLAQPAPGTSPRSALRSVVLVGEQLDTLFGAQLDALADRCGAGATSRSAWLAPTARALGSRVWAVAVHDQDHELRAAMVLLDEQRLARVLDGSDPGRSPHRLVDVVQLAGSSAGHCSAVLADDAPAARLLGHAYWEALKGRGRPVLTALGPVAPGGADLLDVAAGMPGAELVAACAVPTIERRDSPLAEDYLSASMRRTLRKAANRTNTDGRRTTLRFTADLAEIRALLPDLERLHRDRDHDQGRISRLDDPHEVVLHRGRLTALAEAGCLEVATLRIDDELAAHVVGLLDGRTYRVLEGILASRFARYSPGRVLETEVLQRMLDDSGLDTLDWVSSVASETLLAANGAVPTTLLRAAIAGPAVPAVQD